MGKSILEKYIFTLSIVNYPFQAIDTDNGFTNTKYNILMMMHADMDQKEGLDTQDSKCFEEIWLDELCLLVCSVDPIFLVCIVAPSFVLHIVTENCRG